MPEQPKATILIADDEPLFLRTTAALLRKSGYKCINAPDGEAAIEALQRQPVDLILSDLSMPGNLKLELLREGRDKWPEIPLIVVTGVPSLPTAIESVRLGITDYLLKPVSYPDLLASVRRALSGRQYSTRSAKTDRDSGSPCASFPEIVGESESMQTLCELVERIAETNANVLITGESGTGKEVIAKAVHRKSRRATSAFQVIDCTAIPDSLFESVLFGHVKGAFTGAVNDQPGLLRQADGGTAFFDEIGELPLPLQSKLLRVIQEQTFTPVGQHSLVRIDTRFLCATNRDLETEVNAGRFRQDLFYRLAVIHLEIPPLRERGQDILLLARHFLRELQQPGARPMELSPEAESCLLRYSWPGNVRELRNAIERGVVMARSGQILPSDLPGAVHTPASVETRSEAPQGSSRIDALQDAERDYLIGLLQKNSGNVARSAKEAGMSRQGLHKLLKKHGVNAADYRP